ncbi:MAG: hypothetical protein OXP75_02400 [Rhodospirillales bacterium]|nr:hypothetical protein [Rhodospirillales bacterium]
MFEDAFDGLRIGRKDTGPACDDLDCEAHALERFGVAVGGSFDLDAVGAHDASLGEAPTVGEREGGELSFLANVRRPVVARKEERGARAKFPLPRRARASTCQAAVRVENMPPLPGKRRAWPLSIMQEMNVRAAYTVLADGADASGSDRAAARGASSTSSMSRAQ